MCFLKKNHSRAILTLVSLFMLSFLCASCADSEADVISATSTVVFDYDSADASPSVRLAVFLQVTNAVQRTESFSVSHAQTGYSWNVTKPEIFTGLNKSYAFSLNLNAPEGETIPTGEYAVTYYDATGGDDEIKFSVNYKKELLSVTAEKCRDFITNPTENIAIYDETGELLFMGKAKNNWKNNEAILKDYKLASTKRTCYVSPGNAVICLLPEEKLKSEN